MHFGKDCMQVLAVECTRVQTSHLQRNYTNKLPANKIKKKLTQTPPPQMTTTIHYRSLGVCYVLWGTFGVFILQL